MNPSNFYQLKKALHPEVPIAKESDESQQTQPSQYQRGIGQRERQPDPEEERQKGDFHG